MKSNLENQTATAAEHFARFEADMSEFEGVVKIGESEFVVDRETFNPSVNVEGKTVAVPGFAYIVAFALQGVAWAVKAVEEDPSIEAKFREWQRRMDNQRVTSEIERRERALDDYITREKESIAVLRKEQLRAHMNWAAAKVASWPAWKRGILEQSGSPTVKTPRTPV